MELRCPNKLHGELITPGTGFLRVACDSRFCGKAPGVAVRHIFDLSTGAIADTKQYRIPNKIGA